LPRTLPRSLPRTAGLTLFSRVVQIDPHALAAVHGEAPEPTMQRMSSFVASGCLWSPVVAGAAPLPGLPAWFASLVR